ncbi:flocculation protein FLO11-like [Clupea harengus]|uniref:Flocculation protein FLO11-like n=1 Tax=Clupea harengus TaxID=7950 RepID=A0A6P8GHK9_CLUHA|nr:flocculation protein FLO11-like [Clupea harengus]
MRNSLILMLSDVLLLFGAVTVRPVVANMENFTLCTKRTEDVSHPDPSGSPHPCSPDTPSEADRHELLYDILRLPTTQFQELCCGMRNNMTAEELAQMFASWTEDRVRKNIFETMAELEERKNILSSSYHERIQHNKEEMTEELPEVQLAPVTKEIFGTVLDSLQGSSSDLTKVASKQQFVSYLSGMVHKIKAFPKRLKPSRKVSKELSITPDVCKTLSDLLAPPDTEGGVKSTQSTTSLHSDVDRLCAEDDFNRASENVNNILFTTPVSSSSQDDITQALQPDASSLSVSSGISVHDDARGIVTTIVTDLEHLYEGMEPKEIEMLQNQEEPIGECHTTEKTFNNKVYNVLCRTQIKLRMFFTVHHSQDIVTDSDMDLPTEDPSLADTQEAASLAETGDGPDPGPSDGEVPKDEWAELGDGVIETIAETSPTSEIPVVVISDSNKRSIGGKIKNIFAKQPKSLNDAPVLLVDTQEAASLAETGDGPDTVSLASETHGQQAMMTSSQTCFKDEPKDEWAELGDGVIETIAETSPTSETPAVVISNNNRRSIGNKIKNIFVKHPKSLNDAPVLLVDTQEAASLAETGDGPDTVSLASETHGQQAMTSLSQTCVMCDSVMEPTAETGHVCQASPVLHTIGNKFKNLFHKKTTNLKEFPTVPVDTQEAVSALAETGEDSSGLDAILLASETHGQQSMASSSQTCLQDDHLTVPADREETESQCSAISEPPAAMTTAENDGNKRGIGRKLKTLFTRQPKNLSEGPKVPIISQEPIPSLEETVADSSTPEVVLQAFEAYAPAEESAPLSEDVYVCDGPATPSLSPEEELASGTVSSNNKDKRLSIGTKLKNVFTKQPKSPQGSQAMPANTQEALSTDRNMLRTCTRCYSDSNLPGAAVPEEFSNVAEATAALKETIERVRTGLDDPATATAKIELLMSRGVLRPFVRPMVDSVFNYMSATSGSPASSAPGRFASETTIQKTQMNGEQRRVLVWDENNELAVAFARRAVRGVLVQVLGILVPLSEEAAPSESHGMDMVTNIMTKEVISKVSTSSSSTVSTSSSDSVEDDSWCCGHWQK